MKDTIYFSLFDEAEVQSLIYSFPNRVEGGRPIIRFLLTFIQDCGDLILNGSYGSIQPALSYSSTIYLR